MRWLKPNLRSIYGLLGNSPAPSESVLEDSTEDVRETMLDALGEAGSRHFPQITRRIRYAADIQSLWYLRGDLMAALASMHGEKIARQRIASITAQFQGLLPGGLNSRPSPLVG
jgi:predicted urease superfamily metal-dependent hydrolase